jgi:outer membrane protein assembly factor BamA
VNIDEGVPRYVEQIVVNGNTAFSTRRIKSLLRCHARNLKLLRTGSFNPSLFREDTATIRTHYIKKGYLDVVPTISVSTGSTPGRVVLQVDISEGPQYKIGSLQWHQRILSSSDFTSVSDSVNVRSGDAYDAELPARIESAVKHACNRCVTQELAIVVQPMISQDSTPECPRVDILVRISKLRDKERRIMRSFNTSLSSYR